MKYRKWDSNTKAKIVLEGLQNKMLLSGLCNRHQITQNTYYNWLKKFETKSHKVFESLKESKKELKCWVEQYNCHFPHSSLLHKTPDQAEKYYYLSTTKIAA
jgi:transposase-like protein